MTSVVLTCSPYFTDLALNEVRRHHPQITFSEMLFPGYLALETPGSFEQLTAPWQHRLPIYLHHCFPVERVVPLADVGALKRALRPFGTATIQLRSLAGDDSPFAAIRLHPLFGTARRSTPPAHEVVSALIVPTLEGIRAYIGRSSATQNLSVWAGGQIPIREAVPNRAGYKLLEALDTFAIRLRVGNHALDLGAAPGAWTTLLRARQMRVTAVAPAPLYPWLVWDRGVIHQPLYAEHYLQHCDTTFDLIVNDMKLDARESARLMVGYAAHLRSQGIALMTLKLRERSVAQVMDHTFRILRKAYKIIRVRQLVSNRREVTLFLRRLS